MKEIIN